MMISMISDGNSGYQGARELCPSSSPNVISTNGEPLVVTKIELGKMLLQMFLTDVMVNVIRATLQNRQTTFDGVGMRIIVTCSLSSD